MFRRTDDDAGHDDESIVDRRLGPAAPALVWGVLMTTALAGAAATVWLGSGSRETLVASRQAPNETLRHDLARLAAQGETLAGRLASLERGVGEMKLAGRAGADPQVTGSIARRPALAAQSFGLTLGTEASFEAAKRRWEAVAARHPKQLGRLAALARPDGAGTLWDVVAGPFATRGEAEVACIALAEQGLACDTTDYAGEPIARP